MRTLSSHPRPAGERGFTLIELMIGMTLVSLLILFAMQTFNGTNAQAQRIEKLVDIRQSARAAVQLIERDVRMSGSGWGRIPVSVSDNGVSRTFYALTPGHGAGDNDSIQIMGAWSANTTIANSMPNSSAVLKVNDTSGFAPGDLVVISDGGSAHMFQLTQVNSSSGILQHNPSSPWNVPGGFSNWPAGGYGPGTQVFKINILSYSVDSTSFRRPALVRRDFLGAPQVVAFDVHQFQVWYRLQDSTLTRDPLVSGPGLAQIDKVRPVVFTRLLDRQRVPFVDSLWSEVQPRTF